MKNESNILIKDRAIKKFVDSLWICMYYMILMFWQVELVGEAAQWQAVVQALQIRRIRLQLPWWIYQVAVLCVVHSLSFNLIPLAA